MHIRSERRRTQRLAWLASVRDELQSAQAVATSENAIQRRLAGQIDAALAEAEALEARLKAGAVRS